MDEVWVAELEEDRHLGFFSSSLDDDGDAEAADAPGDGDSASIGGGVTGAMAALGVKEERWEAQRLADEAARLRAAVAAAEGRLRRERELLGEEEGVVRGEAGGVRGLMAEWEALDAELAAVAAAAERREEVGRWVCCVRVDLLRGSDAAGGVHYYFFFQNQ